MCACAHNIHASGHAHAWTHPGWLGCTDLPMGVLSIVLAANSDKKLDPLTQLCSAYSWLNVGGKLLKLVALKRLFAEEKDIKRKMQKLSGR